MPVTLSVKVTTSRIYLQRVALAVLDAVDEGVGATIKYGAIYAKRKAPVRKVTDENFGRRALTRDLTPQEISDLPDFAKKGLSPISGRAIRTGELPRTTVRRSDATRFVLDPRFGRTSRDVTFDRGGEAHMLHADMGGQLNTKGRAELGLQRAFISVSEETRKPGRPYLGKPYRDKKGQLQRKLHSPVNSYLSERTILGGRLRKEIHAVWVSGAQTGSGIAVGSVESPTPYARYVEFPTSRTAAQPYMRPAREAMKPVLRAKIIGELKRIGRAF